MGLVHAGDVAPQWLLQFICLSDLAYLMLAVLSTASLVLPYRGFFSSSPLAASETSGNIRWGEPVVGDWLRC